MSRAERLLVSPVYQAALAAHAAGISFLPIRADGSKRPAIRWKAYQTLRPTPALAERWFARSVYGIAFVTGAVSEGLEMLDFDAHEIYRRFVWRAHQEGLDGLLRRIERGYRELSPRGMHLYYRCETCQGNKKLAARAEPPYVRSLIETRGEGGYSIAAPSGGGVHPEGRPYQCVEGSLATIVRITSAERALLHALARTFDEPAEREKPHGQIVREHASSHERRRPGTIFSERVSWSELLPRYGWTWVRRVGEEDFWRRPGKDQGISATTNYEGSDLLYVFSTSTPFEAGVGIGKFAAYTIFEHQGDFAHAAKALVAQGFVEERGEN